MWLMNKYLSISLKILGFIFVGITCLVFLIWAGLNIFKNFYYNEYFSAIEKIAKNPGLSDNFMPQGITCVDNYYATSGYMLSDECSRLYLVDKETGETKYFSLVSEGKKFTGHTGGLQYKNGFFYLANEGNSLYKFPVELIYEEENQIEIGSPIKMNNNTSFVFSRDNFLYVGEFCKDGNYPCDNVITYEGKKHRAIVSKYELSDLTKPVAIYSIPDLVQGFCIKKDGTIILSRSWGLNPSEFYLYEPSNIIKTGTTYDCAEVYFLAEPNKVLKAPSMSEDLDVVLLPDGSESFITMYESACNKYIFGKFFFADYIAKINF
ncbi:MAG: hypothetical protein IIX47_08025 [Spirochaetaceae bacterium]|nr:hypothetical protein [Spirochaetaceae bacterium]